LGSIVFMEDFAGEKLEGGYIAHLKSGVLKLHN
jgi:hypothetical protein